MAGDRQIHRTISHVENHRALYPTTVYYLYNHISRLLGGGGYKPEISIDYILNVSCIKPEVRSCRSPHLSLIKHHIPSGRHDCLTISRTLNQTDMLIHKTNQETNWLSFNCTDKENQACPSTPLAL